MHIWALQDIHTASWVSDRKINFYAFFSLVQHTLIVNSRLRLVVTLL